MHGVRRVWGSTAGRAAVIAGAIVAAAYTPALVGMLASWSRSREDWDSTDHPNDMFGMGDPALWYGLLVFVTATAAICVGSTVGFAAAHRGEARVGFGRFVAAAFVGGAYGAIGVAAVGAAADALRGPVIPVVGIPVIAALTAALVVRSVPLSQVAPQEGDGPVP